MSSRLKPFASFLNEARTTTLYHGSPYEFQQFSLKKVGSGDGQNKFGYGLYFVDNEDTARIYASELSIGPKAKKGFNIYEVRITGIENFYEWTTSLDLSVIKDVCETLRSKRKGKVAKELWKDSGPDSGYDPFDLDSLYSWLTHAFGGSKAKTTAFLFDCGIYGARVESDFMHEGVVYVAFSDSIVRIVDHYKLSEREGSAKEEDEDADYDDDGYGW